jgi:hypothetical protein
LKEPFFSGYVPEKCSTIFQRWRAIDLQQSDFNHKIKLTRLFGFFLWAGRRSSETSGKRKASSLVNITEHSPI